MIKSKTYKNIKYFQSDLLKEYEFDHAFFTKRYIANKPLELQNELNLNSNIHYLKQTHSNKVIQVFNTTNLKPKVADCLITKEKNQSLWIYTADCIPILFADTKTRNVAACHCGLKGLKNKILAKTIKKLEKIGSSKNNLIIAIGPSITVENYQVNVKDIEDLIIEKNDKSYMRKSYCAIIDNKKEFIPLFKEDSNPEKLFIDIQAAATSQIYKDGIKYYQININRLCTYSNPNLFYSFRRDNTLHRQWSCIYS